MMSSLTWVIASLAALGSIEAVPEAGEGGEPVTSSAPAPSSPDGAEPADAEDAPDELVAPPPSAAEEGAEPSAPPPEPDDVVADDRVDSDQEPLEPAELPEAAPDPPATAEPHARGGAILTPLPPAPAPEDPSTLSEGPWRGRGWLGLGLAISVPLGGKPPAAGTVVAAVGEVTVGWRINRVLALHTALSTFAHDAGQRTVLASDGTAFDEVAYGRITAFDLVTARVYLPRPRRIEPWAEAGLGVGIRRDAFATERQAVGLARVGLGVDFWLAPIFSLGVTSAYRLAIIDRSVGHGLRTGIDLGIHW